MAAARKPLEFHAKRPWGGEEAVEDPDEDSEEDNDEAENGFSLEEVLRLGGTKVMASDSDKGTEAPGVVSQVIRRVAWEGVLNPDSSFETVLCPSCTSFLLLSTREECFRIERVYAMAFLRI